MSLTEFLQGLPGYAALRDPWLYAGVSAAHILGIALLVGTMVQIDLRLMGLWRRASPREALRALPFAWAGFGLLLTSGWLLFMTRPAKYLENPAFQIKLALIALGLVNVVMFHRFARKTLDSTTYPMVFGAFISLVVWLAVLFAGRMIAFV